MSHRTPLKCVHIIHHRGWEHTKAARWRLLFIEMWTESERVELCLTETCRAEAPKPGQTGRGQKLTLCVCFIKQSSSARIKTSQYCFKHKVCTVFYHNCATRHREPCLMLISQLGQSYMNTEYLITEGFFGFVSTDCVQGAHTQRVKCSTVCAAQQICSLRATPVCIHLNDSLWVCLGKISLFLCRWTSLQKTHLTH